MEIIKKRLNNVNRDAIYRPCFFRLSNPEEKLALNDLIQSDEAIEVRDEIFGQLKELIKSLNPSIRISLTIVF